MRIVDVTAQPAGAIPLAEVSGLALGRTRGDTTVVAAIGDRAATIAWAELAADGAAAPLKWQTLPLSHAAGTRIPQQDPQLEAIAMDGGGRILLVQEWPCRAEYIDAVQRKVLARFTLTVPDKAGPQALRRSWADPTGSHAEGVALMRDGHLLIVKEKDPAALLEFGPAGDAPGGFGPDRWLPAGQPWYDVPDSPEPFEADLELLACWAPSGGTSAVCPDLSDADVVPGGNLIVLSDKGRSVALVPASAPAPQPFSGAFEPDVVWRVSGIEDKPEGIVVLPDGDVLVACDRRKSTKNLFRISRGEWDRPGSIGPV